MVHELCKEGGGTELSQTELGRVLFAGVLPSTGFHGHHFVALFPSTLEAVSWNIHRSLCTSEFTATLIHAFTVLVVVSYTSESE